MAGDTSIEWTDKVWNPTRGCSRISPGCVNCYAERMAARFSGPGLWAEGFAKRTPAGPRWTGKVEALTGFDDTFDAPLRWQKPSRIFVNSTSDLFHEALSDEEIALVFAVMAQAPQHQFQVLTKRAERMHALLTATSRTGGSEDFRCLVADTLTLSHENALEWPLPIVWLGVSVENQKYGDRRIPLLAGTPAAIRFLSCEPLLGPLDLSRYLKLVDWVIVGGESGPGARPFDVAWGRVLVEQCRHADVRCFVKQLGAHPMRGRGRNRAELNLESAKGGDPAEWPRGLDVRQFPEARRVY